MIGIIYCNDLNMCPFIDKYIDSLERNQCDYKVILWNRNGIRKKYSEKYIIYNHKSDLYMSKWKKIYEYYGYYCFINKEIKKYRFDKLILLTSLPAILCYFHTRKTYKGRYIYDFRDLSFEKFPLYKIIVRNIIRNSYFTCSSSPGFKDIIREKVINCHNFKYSDLEKQVYILKEPVGRIKLLQIGMSRGEIFNKQIADVFGNDSRFEINIVGMGNNTSSFLEYVSEFKNIHVLGDYNNEEKAKFIKDAHALLYYYPCSFNNNRALANKYYDGMIYKKPLIGNINTYSGKRVEEKGIGVSVDFNKGGAKEKIYKYFTNFNKETYMKSVDKELNGVIAEDNIYIKRIDMFVTMD